MISASQLQTSQLFNRDPKRPAEAISLWGNWSRRLVFGTIGLKSEHLSLEGHEIMYAAPGDPLQFVPPISGLSMRKAGALVVTVFFGLLSVAALADDVPKLNFNKSCRSDVAAYPSGGGNKACITDEQRARKTLVSQWKRFSPQSRTRCTAMVTDMIGSQSYVELLTCLQMARDVQSLPKQ
jgi:hypothetical protein